MDRTPENWLEEIADARKREKTYRKDGQEVEKIYEAGKSVPHSFNILYSNTETLLPALYNNTPRPEVERRFKDEDPVARASAQLIERTLQYQLDQGSQERTDFDSLVAESVLAALVPGRGLARFFYEPVLGEDGGIQSQTIYGKTVPWQDFTHGFARAYADVPWYAFLHYMNREELTTNFPDVGALVPLTAANDDGDKADEESGEKAPADSGGEEFAPVWEIWCKTSRMVYFVSPNHKDAYLKEPAEDPYGLDNFYPFPQPLTFASKLSSLVPVAIYKFYKEQAAELNRISTRINKLVSALRVRGMYDSSLEGIEEVLAADDNTLKPAQNVASMLQGQSLERAIWLVPLDTLVQVLQQLYTQREQTKRVIYEITGIGDILRGASAASETLGAQQIKESWGTLRMRKMQKRVQQYVRECLRIQAELAAKHFTAETFQTVTNMKFPPKALQQQIGQQLAQQSAMTPPGQPPASPPPQIEEIMNTPALEDVMGLLKDPFARNYRVDVETNSTVDIEATEDKRNIGEFMNAFAQFMNGIAPAVQTGAIPFEASKAMLMAVVRRYRFGVDVEKELDKMKAPPTSPAPDDGKVEAQKMQMEMQKMQMQAEIEKGKAQLEMQRLQQEMDFERQRHLMRMREVQVNALIETQTDATV